MQQEDPSIFNFSEWLDNAKEYSIEQKEISKVLKK